MKYYLLIIFIFCGCDSISLLDQLDMKRQWCADLKIKADKISVPLTELPKQVTYDIDSCKKLGFWK